MQNNKYFYKEDLYPNEIWINDEILIQLNITPKCPLNCEFCYIKWRYREELEWERLKKFLLQLKKWNEELGIVYNINLTGGDIFYYSNINDLIDLLSKLDYITRVDLLINRFWKEKHKRLVEKIIDKIHTVQFNIMVVQEEDIEWTREHNKIAAVKYPLYRGKEKKLLDKTILLMKKYDNLFLGFDLIIPQTPELAKYSFIKDENSIRESIEIVKEIIGTIEKEVGSKNRILTSDTIINRELFGEIYLCPVGFASFAIMPDGKIVPCARYPFLDTKYTIENFDLVEYFKKYNKLVSNACLFENKYFNEYWDPKLNPRNWV